MTEGFWINFKMGTHGKVVPIHEHETDIRKPEVWKRLGIDKASAEIFPEYKIGKDRDRFMTMLMTKFPLIRVRGHGTTTTFEYAYWGRNSAIDAIKNFAENNLGNFSMITINNLVTGESKTLSLGEFLEIYETKGAEGIMRKGSENIDRELSRIAKVVKSAKRLKFYPFSGKTERPKFKAFLYKCRRKDENCLSLWMSEGLHFYYPRSFVTCNNCEDKRVCYDLSGRPKAIGTLYSETVPLGFQILLFNQHCLTESFTVGRFTFRKGN